MRNVWVNRPSSRHIDNPRIRNCPDFIICLEELPTPAVHMRFAGIVLEKVFVRNAVSGVAPCTIARVRGSRGALQLVDGSQPCLAGSAKHLLWSSAALLSSEPPVWSRFRRFPDQRGSDDVCEMVRKRDQTGGSDDKRGRTAVEQDDTATEPANIIRTRTAAAAASAPG